MFKNQSIIRLWLITFVTIQSFYSCHDNNVVIVNHDKGWKPFGLDSIAVNRLVFDEPYIYACAGKKGLWRRNVRIQSEWEYLCLKDSTPGDDEDVGVTEVDIKGSDILVLFSPGEMMEYFDTALVGIWRSKDNGKTFNRSDSGIVDDNGDPSHLVYSIGRSYQNPMIGLATRGARFRTTNGGDDWYPIDDIRLFLSWDKQKWNPKKSLDVWITGNTGLSDFIVRSKDGGVTDVSLGIWPTEVGGGYYDIEFDAVDTSVIYLATGVLLKSIDDGKKWFYPMGAHSLFFGKICSHPRIHNLLYLVSENIYRSTDGGGSIVSIGSPSNAKVRDMIINSISDILYIATDQGIFEYIP